MVNSVESFTEVNESCKDSMRVLQVQGSVDKREEFDEIMSYREAFHSKLARIQERFYYG